MNSSLVGAWSDFLSSKVATLEEMVSNATRARQKEEDHQEVPDPSTGFVKVMTTFELLCSYFQEMTLSLLYAYVHTQIGPSNYYGFFSAKMSFSEAIVYCAHDQGGSHLPVFDSLEEYEQVGRLNN